MKSRLLFLCVIASAAIRVVSGCRWAAYAGKDLVDAEEILLKAPHSLVRQAVADPILPQWEDQLKYNPQTTLKRNHGRNLDGFGVGWYENEGGRAVAKRERSSEPAVGDDGLPHATLLRIARQVKSNVIFAHIRAATDGDASRLDSHPFLFNNILFMHNGGVARKEELKKSISCERANKLIKGSTDSEIAGAVFVSHLVGDVCSLSSFTRAELEKGMMSTVSDIEATENACKEASSLNLAATDGNTLVATRYRSCSSDEPPSLYYSYTPGGVWIASEPLDGKIEGATRDWTMLSKDQMLSYNVATDNLVLRCLSFSCRLEQAYRYATRADMACFALVLFILTLYFWQRRLLKKTSVE